MRGSGRLAAAAVAALVALAAAPSEAADPVTALVGAVAFEDGTPAAGARLVLVPSGLNTTADHAGVFRLEAPAGTYKVRASAANTTADKEVVLVEGQTTNVTITIVRGAGPAAASPLVAFLFLGISMIAIAIGGFYVNKRMAERGIELNKSVAGGVQLKKPFRRRHKKPKAP